MIKIFIKRRKRFLLMWWIVEQSIPWDFVKKQNQKTEYRQILSLNATYIIGVVNMNQNCALHYNINFTREARGVPIEPVPVPSNT
jgi:hypothetical protein